MSPLDMVSVLQRYSDRFHDSRGCSEQLQKFQVLFNKVSGLYTALHNSYRLHCNSWTTGIAELNFSFQRPTLTSGLISENALIASSEKDTHYCTARDAKPKLIIIHQSPLIN